MMIYREIVDITVKNKDKMINEKYLLRKIFEIENISDFVEYIIPFLMLNFLMRN